LSGKASIIGITSWRICGPFVVDDQDQRYSPGSEARMFEKDYLEAADGREAPLKLPSRITNVQIDFQRAFTSEPAAPSRSGVFLNQTQIFPTEDVDSQLLYWGSYHVYKVVYAAAEIASSTDQDVVLLSVTNSPIKIWVNDAVQTQTPPGSVGAEWNTDVGVKVHLRAGRNTLLVKWQCSRFRSDFGVWVATPDRAHQFIEEYGGVYDVLNQIGIPRGDFLKLAPIIAMYDEPAGRHGRYEIRDVAGRIATTGHLDTIGDAGINVSALPDGLYSISLEKGTLMTGELFFVGDLTKRLAMYGARCAAKAAGDLPCDALSKLIRTSKDDGAGFRLDEQKPILLLLAQFEWSLDGISPKMIFPDHAPRMRLMSFRSSIDGSIQHYYLHLPPDIQSGRPLPLVVLVPFNTSHEPFFDNMPTAFPDVLQRYARFADRYHLSLITPFAHGEQMPSDLAEDDMLETIQDAKACFRVDDSRIYMAGECDGGRSAFLMGEDYPDVFSAISTIEAMTGDVRTNSSGGSRSVMIRLRNLSSMPIRLTNGVADYHSPSAQALFFTQEARKVGVFPQLKWLTGDGGGGLISRERRMFEFFATVRRDDPAIPHRVALAVTN
jgi:hypothetical protein